MEANKQETLNNQTNEASDFIDLENFDPLQPNPEAENVENTNGEADQKDGGKLIVEPQQSEGDRDASSVFVKNVHYNAEKKEIEEHFADCGEIKMITVMNNKMTQQPLG